MMIFEIFKTNKIIKTSLKNNIRMNNKTMLDSLDLASKINYAIKDN